jgi:hypothetical protein
MNGMRLRLRTLVISVAAAGAICTGLPAATASAASTSVASTSVVPRVGQCYKYTWDQSAAYSSPTAAISCNKPHTAVTYFVNEVTGPAKASKSPTANAVVTYIYQSCIRHLESRLGTKVGLTRAFLGVISYEPTAAQWKAGSRFYRCDATNYREHPTEFLSIPSSYLKALKTTTGRTKYAWCLTTGLVTVPCSVKHATKALAVVTLATASAKYPGSSAVLKKTESMCAAAVKKLHRTWSGVYWHPGSSAAWAAGYRTATCFQKG